MMLNGNVSLCQCVCVFVLGLVFLDHEFGNRFRGIFFVVGCCLFASILDGISFGIENYHVRMGVCVDRNRCLSQCQSIAVSRFEVGAIELQPNFV